ncbi:hypothetical protein MTO96_015902 [Rhipicephalus appendiculatus]
MVRLTRNVSQAATDDVIGDEALLLSGATRGFRDTHVDDEVVLVYVRGEDIRENSWTNTSFSSGSQEAKKTPYSVSLVTSFSARNHKFA